MTCPKCGGRVCHRHYRSTNYRVCATCGELNPPWKVVHPDAGDVGLRTPRFATEAEARGQAAKWNRNYPGHVVIGPDKPGDGRKGEP